jgi:hypothetical protein
MKNVTEDIITLYTTEEFADEFISAIERKHGKQTEPEVAISELDSIQSWWQIENDYTPKKDDIVIYEQFVASYKADEL